MFSIGIPDVEFSELPALIVSALAIALLVLVQTVSVAKPMATAQQDKLIPKKEFIGQGLASISSGLVGGMPTAGSLAQSAVNYDAGARTKNSAIISGVFVFLTTLLFFDVINKIPTACLSSIVMVSAMRLINLNI